LIEIESLLVNISIQLLLKTYLTFMLGALGPISKAEASASSSKGTPATILKVNLVLVAT